MKFSSLLSPQPLSPADCSPSRRSPPASGGGSNTPTCPSGQVYNQQKKMCVDSQSGVIDDKSLTDLCLRSREGRPLRGSALATLDLLQNPNTAEALNYRGYATRKLGRVDEGIGYYLQSVALDPGLHAGARISRRSLCDQGRCHERQAPADRDREALRHDLRALPGSCRGDRRRDLATVVTSLPPRRRRH